MFRVLTKEDKLELISFLNWDYADTPEELLSLIETGNSEGCAFTEETLFARSLETLRWEDLTDLWTVEKCIKLYSPKVKRMLFDPFLRWKYDRVFAILRKEPIPVTEQDSMYFEQMRKSFLFNRRHGIK